MSRSIFKALTLSAITSAALLLSSCAKQPASGGQHATVLLRDGTSVNGTVLSSSPSEIQIAGSDNITRKIPMTQVRSIEYDETPAATPAAGNPEPTAPPPAAASNPAPAAASAPPPSAAPAAAPAAARPPAQELSRAAVDPQPEPEHHHPTEAAVTSRTHILAVGTPISVRTEETIDSSKATEGQLFPASVTRDILDPAGAVVIPRGSNAQIIIRSATKGGKIRGSSDLVLDLASVSIDGREYELSTTDVEEKGKSGIGANRRTATYTGGAAAVGAIIGAIAGGGKGAAIGAGSGAGAGALTQILTKGTIKVPVESILTFRLDTALRVRAVQ